MRFFTYLVPASLILRFLSCPHRFRFPSSSSPVATDKMLRTSVPQMSWASLLLSSSDGSCGSSPDRMVGSVSPPYDRLSPSSACSSGCMSSYPASPDSVENSSASSPPDSLAYESSTATLKGRFNDLRSSHKYYLPMKKLMTFGWTAQTTPKYWEEDVSTYEANFLFVLSRVRKYRSFIPSHPANWYTNSFSREWVGMWGWCMRPVGPGSVSWPSLMSRHRLLFLGRLDPRQPKCI